MKGTMMEKTNSVVGIVSDFLKSYRVKPSGMSEGEWLDGEFARYPEVWADEAERRTCAADVVGGVAGFRASAEALERTRQRGGTNAEFLERQITAGCQAEGTVLTATYAARIDGAIGEANRMMAEQVFVHRPDGTLDYSRVNQAPTLNGNIAEAHHAGSFNIDAATKEVNVHAEMPASHGRNSVDILVKDTDEKILRRYQSKYGADARATQDQFGTDYPGQRKLVPKEQAEKIPGATDHVEEQGVTSKPLTKEEAVAMQKKTQRDGKPVEYDWNDANASVICRHIGKKAAVAGMLAVGFQGARILGRRLWNGMTGKKNKPLSEDMKEFAASASQSGAAAAGMAAVTGGLVVASKKGLLGAALKGAKGNVIANVACAAVENLKVIHKLGTGEVTAKEALDLAGRTNCALVGSLACAAKGATVGATIGSALGPVGAAVGGFVGGVACGIAGSVVGEAVYAGAKKICKAVGKVAAGCVKGACRVVGRVAKALFSWF